MLSSLHHCIKDDDANLYRSGRRGLISGGPRLYCSGT